MDAAHEVVGSGDDHRARFDRLAPLDVFPFVPQHDCLGQWSCGHRTPWGYARDPASGSKACRRVGAVSIGVLLLAHSGHWRSQFN
jgi:hypothetical protein